MVGNITYTTSHIEICVCTNILISSQSQKLKFWIKGASDEWFSYFFSLENENSSICQRWAYFSQNLSLTYMHCGYFFYCMMTWREVVHVKKLYPLLSNKSSTYCRCVIIAYNYSFHRVTSTNLMARPLTYSL